MDAPRRPDESTVGDVDTTDEELDPRRWFTLCILILTVVLIALDTSVLNVSIPTMLRELDTSVPTLQWVITGYSLTYARTAPLQRTRVRMPAAFGNG